MEKKQYWRGKPTYFSPQEIKFVGDCIEKGKSAAEIANIFGVSIPKIFKVIDEYLLLFNKKRSCLGHKDCSYFTEKDMLTPSIYTWENLSKTEKKFYKNYGKKKRNRKRYSSND